MGGFCGPWSKDQAMLTTLVWFKPMEKIPWRTEYIQIILNNIMWKSKGAHHVGTITDNSQYEARTGKAMPLKPTYTWADLGKTIQLRIPLRGHGKSSVDVFATECYLKVSFPPYLLELDLHGFIDSTQPRARVENGVLILRVQKKEGHTDKWDIIGQCVDRKCNPEVRTRRDNSIKQQYEREQELKERKSRRKHEDERLALRSQMNLEEVERKRIEDIKAEEKSKAEEEVYRTFAELAAKQHEEERKSTPPPPLAREEDPARKVTCPQDSSEIFDTDSDIKGNPQEIPAEEIEEAEDLTDADAVDSESSGCQGGDPEEPQGEGPSNVDGRDEGGDTDVCTSYVPEPREPTGIVPIGFTTRLFPTPLRESKVADESAWIVKNRKYLHTNKTLEGRLPRRRQDNHFPIDISQTDPVWLKGKGDDLYRGGDFLGAINAYTAALEADPQAATCLSNRAACYLRTGKAALCAEDCSTALDILKASAGAGACQARLLARRALAYRQLGHYRSSLQDCKAALEFLPGDAALLAEVAVAEPLAACESSKNEAMARFAAGEISNACELYTSALAAVPASPSCLSNRAACYLAMGKPEDCVRDCTTALQLLLVEPPSEGSWVADSVAAGESSAKAAPAAEPSLPCPVMVPPAGSAPPAGSEKRRAWVISTLLRRGRASVEMGRLEAALGDYRTASSLSEGDKTILEDVRELERRMQEAQTTSGTSTGTGT